MIRAIVISPYEQLIHQLEESLAATGESIELVKEYSRYPSKDELTRVISGLAANVIFLDLDSMTSSTRIIEAIEKLPARPAVVAIHNSTAAIVQAMRLGIRDYLIAPFDQPMVNSCVKLLMGLLDPKSGYAPSQSGTKMIAFLPAKPGAGASTVALNTCAALAVTHRTLLVDADPFNGQLAFMLKQDNSFSIRHALDRASDLDEGVWDKMVRSFGQLDVLSGEDYLGAHAASAAPLQQVFDFARAYYDVIACDLPGSLDETAQTVLQQSTRIVLVATPDIASLRLAYCKLHLLDGLGCGKKVSIVLNRTNSRAEFRRVDVEKSLGLPVSCEVPAHNSAVHMALVQGKPVREFAARFQTFASKLVNRQTEPVKQRYRRRFLQFFSIGRPESAPIALLGDGRR
ncbi:MAG TPA: AAA family ATPase [Bryobacteraceae bacterium]|nr:AAA family ATPase [Bryobacteraceae bacterium]